MNYKQIYTISKANKERILKVCPGVPDRSGIYFLLRKEDGFKYAYIGQASKLLSRLADHLNGYQHIDLSLKKHKLWSEDNPVGWKVFFIECPTDELDEKEQFYIKKYANAGYQMRNKTVGGQGKGKSGMDNSKPPKNYYDGLNQGYKNAQKFVANLFEKHLNYSKKSEKPNKNQDKAIMKFEDFLDYTGERGG